jgi:hypothetical protein
MIKEDYGVKAKPIKVRNPQANAIVEWVHQVIGNIIRTFELENKCLDDNDPWKGILSATHCVPKTSGLQHSRQIVCLECKKQPHNIASKNINPGSNLVYY